jgi:hypothetical protein
MDELTCPICMEPYHGTNRPKLLPCQHVVCADCLDGLLGSQGSNVTCPECRHPLMNRGTRMPSAKSFQDHRMIMRMMDLHVSGNTSGSNVICIHCMRKSTVTPCGECPAVLCNNCLPLHNSKHQLQNGVDAIQLQLATGPVGT